MKLPASTWTTARSGSKITPERIAPRLHRLDLLAQQAAEHHHAAVAGGQALLGVQRDRALAHLRLVVVGHPLVLFLA